ncbi:MAG: hypothetical protein COT33_02250 [Candidatus Nealsonbacteria bacterium CG08_land_8_20_14_0_20_38_20]|uniref:DUF4129 domain-containing protein n=1 Tax=Candidatus Nealsonbacteria bacterium CG08_land_8_20_14_0_20_38_20 TaxID=1974705 RepID=A0A2H0YLL1_9BACT|nr:MAG: hypothetical protein COT33_02250 [Candidatus Nealsonbacteria bacterium CG08_land_8_20_14_0_20_38_20]
MNLTDIVSFIIYPDITGWLLALKTLFLIVSVLAAGFIIWAAVFGTGWSKWWFIYDLKEFLTFRPYGAGRFTKQWAQIKKRLDSEKETEWKLAVTEANSLLEKALVAVENLLGGAFEEKLRRLGPGTILNLGQVRESHKVSNDIRLDPDYKLGLEQAKKILEIYESALKDLDVL